MGTIPAILHEKSIYLGITRTLQVATTATEISRYTTATTLHFQAVSQADLQLGQCQLLHTRGGLISSHT